MKVLLGTLVLFLLVCVGQGLALEPYQHTASVDAFTCVQQQCQFSFPRVPEGKLLVITHVSGQVGEADVIAFENSSLPVGGGSAPLVVPKANDSSFLGAPVTYYVSSGAAPNARIFYPKVDHTSLIITISGHLVRDRD